MEISALSSVGFCLWQQTKVEFSSNFLVILIFSRNPLVSCDKRFTILAIGFKIVTTYAEGSSVTLPIYEQVGLPGIWPCPNVTNCLWMLRLEELAVSDSCDFTMWSKWRCWTWWKLALVSNCSSMVLVAVFLLLLGYVFSWNFPAVSVIHLVGWW